MFQNKNYEVSQGSPGTFFNNSMPLLNFADQSDLTNLTAKIVAHFLAYSIWHPALR